MMGRPSSELNKLYFNFAVPHPLCHFLYIVHGSVFERRARYMSTPALVQDEQHQRLEVKLRRELGDQVLRLLDDSLTEDILLNPDGALWAKQMGKGFARVGEMAAAQAASAL